MSRRQVRRVCVRGKTWRIALARPPRNDCEGLCVWETRMIYIRPRAKCPPVRVAVHEILHAALPDLREEAIEEVEEALITGLELILGPL